MKRICIYCFTFSKEFVWDEESYINGTIGNSETWAIKLSEELSKKGNDVYVFANPNQEHVSKNGVHFLKNENLYFLLGHGA